MRFKLRRNLFATSTTLIGILVPLILVEIVLRLIGFEFALYPTKVQFGWPDPITIKRLYQVDKELLWVPKDYHSKVTTWQGKRPSVVFMGDSCTQFGRYDNFLKSIIDDRHPSVNFTFVNVGVGGWSSYQGWQQLTRDVLPIRPSIVTIYYGWNDHWLSCGLEDKEIGKFNLEYPILLYVLSKARIVQLINRAVFILKHYDTDMNKLRPVRVSLSDFTYNLTRMVQIIRDSGIIPVLITAPSFHRMGEEPAFLARRWLNDLHELVPLHQKYMQAVRDVSFKEHVLLLDLHAKFRQLSLEELNNFFIKDGIHLTKKGNKKIAELMYKHFVRNELLKRLIGKESRSNKTSKGKNLSNKALQPTTKTAVRNIH